MVESFPFAILISTALGFLSGLGTGGGSLLVLWLTAVVGMEPLNARAINLLFFIPSALVACWFRRQQGTLKVHHVLPAITAGCAAALLGSWFSIVLDSTLLKKLFGILLIFAGIRELLYKKKNAG